MEKSLLAHSMDREEDCAGDQTTYTLDCHRDARLVWFKN